MTTCPNCVLVSEIISTLNSAQQPNGQLTFRSRFKVWVIPGPKMFVQPRNLLPPAKYSILLIAGRDHEHFTVGPSSRPAHSSPQPAVRGGRDSLAGPGNWRE